MAAESVETVMEFFCACVDGQVRIGRVCVKYVCIIVQQQQSMTAVSERIIHDKFASVKFHSDTTDAFNDSRGDNMSIQQHENSHRRTLLTATHHQRS